MDQIDQVRQKTDLVEIISEQVSLKKAGRNFKGLCPFHEEKTASFIVSSERQIFKCFGCGMGGDVFKFLMEREKMEFGEVLRMLAERVGIELKQFRPTREQKVKEKLLEINHLGSEFYHYLLTKHEVGRCALKYLLKRGIKRFSIKLFKLGYAADEWEAVQNFLIKKKGYRADELEMAGLIIRRSGAIRGYYDRFRGRVMFPLFDHRKRVVGFAGRVLAGDEKKAKYINSPETILYHKSNVLYGLETTKEWVKKKNQAVVVEGELDAISSYQAGVKNVVGIKGTALTEGQVDLLKRFCENIALALDKDAAGDMAARRGIELAEKAGLNVRVIEVKYGKDPDECAQKSAKLWKESVKRAIPVYDFYIKSTVKRFGVDTPEGKRKISDEVSVILAKITNEVIKAHYVKKLAKVLKVSEEAVGKEIERKKKQIGVLIRKPRDRREKEEKNRRERLDEYVLALLLQIESRVYRNLRKIDENIMLEGAVKKVIKKMKDWKKKGKRWDINKFTGSLAAELTEVVDIGYLVDLGKVADDADNLEKELGKALEEMERLFYKEELVKLSGEIKKAEREKKDKKLERLRRKFVEISVLLKR